MTDYLKAMRDADEIARRSSTLGPYVRDDPTLAQLTGLNRSQVTWTAQPPACDWISFRHLLPASILGTCKG
jgi:hypothetical protein